MAPPVGGLWGQYAGANQVGLALWLSNAQPNQASIYKCVIDINYHNSVYLFLNQFVVLPAPGPVQSMPAQATRHLHSR
jgi:hypothetical protein